MKKRFVLFLVAMLSFNLSATTDPTPEASFLILHGELHATDKQKIHISLFAFDTTDCVWYQVEIQEERKEYELLLDPTQPYQVWFQAPGGYTKILYVDAGDPGRWQARMDIKFDSGLAFAHMYQICSQGLGTYTTEFLSGKHAEETLPATNCDYCADKNLTTSNQ
jgi:hypothetical protein